MFLAAFEYLNRKKSPPAGTLRELCRINFKDIEILNDSFGKPSIKLNGTTANYLKKKINNKKYFIYLSLSDDLPWAQATVIISYV